VRLALAITTALVAAYEPSFGVLSASAAECAPVWVQQPFPAEFDHVTPASLAALDVAPAWAVGLPVSSEAIQRPAIAAWTGTAWTSVAAPFTAWGGLTGISAKSAQSAWAVGWLGRQTRWPVSAHWNGSSWSTVSVPRPSGQSATLSDVSTGSTDSAWAVGSRQNSGRIRPLAYQLVGGKWVNRSPKPASGTEAGLTAVAISPGNVAWAVGWKLSSGKTAPWVVRRAGSRWVSMQNPSVPGSRTILTDIAFASPKIAVTTAIVEDADAGYHSMITTFKRTSHGWSSSAQVLRPRLTLR
jgi:hypothetical protein